MRGQGAFSVFVTSAKGTEEIVFLVSRFDLKRKCLDFGGNPDSGSYGFWIVIRDYH